MFSQYFNYSYVCVELQLYNLALWSINEGIGYSGGEVSGRETGLQVKVSSARTKCPVNLILT